MLRDDETIDKALLGYADRAISIRFNSLLKEAVPKLEKADRSVGEMLSVTDDPLLVAVRDRRYMVKFNDVSMPFEDLRYWAIDGGYALSISDNRNSTIVSKEEGGRYLVKCPRCDDQALRVVKRGNEIRAIACSKCRTRLVQVQEPEPLVEPKALGPKRPRRYQRSGSAKPLV